MNYHKVFSILLARRPSSVLYYSQHPFFGTPCLLSILDMRDQVSHVFKTKGTVLILYVLSFTSAGGIAQSV